MQNGGEREQRWSHGGAVRRSVLCTAQHPWRGCREGKECMRRPTAKDMNAHHRGIEVSALSWT
jgi:hypothetical protein